MIKKMILLVVAILLMGASMTGCSVLEKGIDEYSKDKEECVLNTDNVTQFTYKGCLLYTSSWKKKNHCRIKKQIRWHG